MTANQNPYKGIYKCKARYCGDNSELKDAVKQFQISTSIRVLSSFDIFNPQLPTLLQKYITAAIQTVLNIVSRTWY